MQQEGPQQSWKQLPDGLSEDRRRFVTCLREVRMCSPRTQADIAQDANQAATTLSNHLNGGRVPEQQLLVSFYKVVEEDALAAGVQLPHTLDTLLSLRARALVKHCTCCATGFPADNPSAGMPASASLPHLWHRRRLRKAARRLKFSPPLVQRSAPVPLPEGDRHPKPSADEAWTDLETLTRYLADGRDRDASVVLWSAATTLPPGDVPSVVGACRSAGLDQEAETVLIHAGTRDPQTVLAIASAFHDRRRFEDAGLMLAAAARAIS
ncbi:hypothetical protein ABZ734_25660 [Streptomyces sp. NPDC006660]|uniref:hypothetical protein n=1 Tax=unclassified Streptomyces TaxID=2593676 RepID=UPI0033C78964